MRSVATDHEQEQNPDESRMDIDESAVEDAPNLQRDIKRPQQQPSGEAAARPDVVVVGKTKTGAAAPGPLPGGFAPSTPAARSKQEHKPAAKPKQAGYS